MLVSTKQNALFEHQTKRVFLLFPDTKLASDEVNRFNISVFLTESKSILLYYLFLLKQECNFKINRNKSHLVLMGNVFGP